MTNKNQLKILFVEDNPTDVELAVLELKKEKLEFKYSIVCSRVDMIRALKAFSPDLIISDYMMPAFNGLQALKVAKEFDPEIPFILCTGSINEETAVECIKAGANDYVIKEHLTRLPFAVNEAMEQADIRKEKRASELLLRESEEKTQSIFKTAPVGIGLVVNRTYVEVNETFSKMTGYKRNEIIGKCSSMLYPSKEEFEAAGAIKYDQIAKKGIGSVETRLKCKDGRILNIISTSAPLDQNDLSKGVTFSILDITERKKTEDELKSSYSVLNASLESTADGILIVDGKGKIIKWNNKFADMWDIPAKTLSKHNDNEAINHILKSLKDPKEFLSKVQELYANPEKSSLDKIEFKNGQIFERYSQPQILENTIVGRVWSFRDVTIMSKAEESLKHSEEKFRSIAENLSDIIFITDTNGIVQYVSPSSANLGYSEEEFTGKFFGEFLADGEFEKAMKLFNNALNSINLNNTVSLIFKRKDGKHFYAELTGSVFNMGNEKKGVLGLLRDISDKMNKEMELRKLSMSVEQSPASIVITDIEGNIEYVNPKLCELTGYSKNELIGKNPSIMSSGEKSKEEYKILWNNIKEGKAWKGKFHNKKKNGDLYWESALISPIKNENNEITHYLGTKEDITEQIRASELMKLAKEKAEASDKLKTSFLNNISHEVRTPLNGILGFSELLTQATLSEDEKKDSLSMLNESSNRLLNTITNYMDISLLTSKNMSVDKKDIIPAQILRKIYNAYQEPCILKKLELFLEMPEQADTVLFNSDPEIFRKIISHLLNNASKFTDKGSITFGFNILDSKLDFFVKDTGRGIKKESFDNIFERFVKEDRGTSMLSEGSGLGLSIALGMAKIIGGDIRIESEIGIGSCFFLSIPFNKSSELTLPPDKVKDIKKILSGQSVLVAEDEETNFSYLKSILIRETGSIVLHAENGRKAIDLFKSNPNIKLILMDIKMPEVDGFEATRQIKLINREIPIIAITAFAMSGDEAKALAAGCDGYLSKPISKKSLMEKMAEFVEI